ncbi:hypothetical protein Tco_0631919 [Tanacetum coccineum]
MGPPPATPGSEKTMSFQKSILGPRPKHIIVNKAKVPVASDNEVKQFYKPLSKPEVRFSKPNFRSKTPPPRRVNNNYSRPKTPQPKRHVGRQNHPHGFPICLGVDLEPNEWIKDSGCSKYMTGNQKLFSTYKAYNGGNVIFGSNLRGNIIGKGQICDNTCKVTFSEHDSEITKNGKVIGYSQNSEAYIILNKHTRKVEESLNVTFDETPPPSKTSPLVDDDLDEEEAIKVTEKKNLENDIVDEPLGDESWIVAMQEELNLFIANDRRIVNKALGDESLGTCVFTDKWSLDELAYGVPKDGPYQTNPPSPDDIVSSIRIDREGQVRRIRHAEEIDVLEYQVLTREIEPTLRLGRKYLGKCLLSGGNQDHVPVCLCSLALSFVHSKKFNLAYFMAKRMERVTKQKRLILPYGMLLTRLFNVYNESYVLYYRVMNLLRQTRAKVIE